MNSEITDIHIPIFYAVGNNQKRNVKRWSFWALLISAGILGLISLISNISSSILFLRSCYLTFKDLNLIQIVAIITPIIAWVIAEITHRCDEKYKGDGIRHLVYQIKPRLKRFNTDPDVLAATMTKQSVLAAVAAILLAIVQLNKDFYTVKFLEDGSIIASFQMVAAVLSTTGFLGSILLLLVSMKCYDYANRFKFSTEQQIKFIEKGLDWDIWSWYLLLFSFSLGIATMSAIFSILVSFAAGFLLWRYYFIAAPDGDNDTVADKSTPEPIVDNKTFPNNNLTVVFDSGSKVQLTGTLNVKSSSTPNESSGSTGSRV